MPKPNAEPGTYALVLAADERQTIQVGRLGTLDVRPGYYVYVGSALGPGGLAARVGRHAKDAKRLRWHVDYLRAVTRLVDVWYVEGDQRRECLWAEALAGVREVQVPAAGFGASDCRCRSHLFYFPDRPSLDDFWQAIQPVTGNGVQPRMVRPAVVAPGAGPGGTRRSGTRRCAGRGPAR